MQNYLDTVKLKNEARDIGCGSIYIKGYWEEENLTDTGEVAKNISHEVSLFIIPGDRDSNIIKKWGIAKLEEYDQTAIIYGDSEGAHILNRDGTEELHTNTYYNEGKLDEMPEEDFTKLIEKARSAGSRFVRGQGYSELVGTSKMPYKLFRKVSHDKEQRNRRFKFESVYEHRSWIGMMGHYKRANLTETIRKITTGDGNE
jgi:hypothetical protein